jgi:hypothetical protein
MARSCFHSSDTTPTVHFCEGFSGLGLERVADNGAGRVVPYRVE